MVYSVSLLLLSKLDNNEQEFKKQALSTVSINSGDVEMKATQRCLRDVLGLKAPCPRERDNTENKTPSDECEHLLSCVLTEESEKTFFLGKSENLYYNA